MNNTTPKKYATVLMGTIALATASSFGAIISLDTLNNGGFEASDISGEDNGAAPGWSDNDGRVVETGGGFQSDQWASPAGAASQVGMNFAHSGTSGGSTSQVLTGTSDSNGVSHNLTAGEATGQTFTLDARLGIQSFAGWPTAHQILVVSLEGGSTTDDWVIFSGTVAQAGTIAITGGYTVSDIDEYLSFDGTSTTGAGVDWSHDFDVTGTGTDLLAVNFTVQRNEATQGRFTFDDVAVTVVPEPSSAALLGLGGLALILRRRK